MEQDKPKRGRPRKNRQDVMIRVNPQVWDEFSKVVQPLPKERSDIIEQLIKDFLAAGAVLTK